MLVSLVVTYALERKVAMVPLVSGIAVALLGSLTLYLHDDQFIKWKPTVINWLFGLGFLASQLFGRQTAIERMLGGSLTLPEAVWRRLNLGWVVFFLCSGGANLYVMSHFDRNTWVNFKLFGMLGLTMLFIVIQSFYLSRYIADSGDKETADKI